MLNNINKTDIANAETFSVIDEHNGSTIRTKMAVITLTAEYIKHFNIPTGLLVVCVEPKGSAYYCMNGMRNEMGQWFLERDSKGGQIDPGSPLSDYDDTIGIKIEMVNTLEELGDLVIDRSGVNGFQSIDSNTELKKFRELAYGACDGYMHKCWEFNANMYVTKHPYNSGAFSEKPSHIALYNGAKIAPLEVLSRFQNCSYKQ